MKHSIKCCVVGLMLIIVVCVAGLEAQLKCEMTDDPAKVQLFYDDIHNFIRALDLLKQGGDPQEVLQKEYIDKASPGLKEYLREKGKSIEDYISALQKWPDRYSALRGLPDQLVPQENRIRETHSELRAVIPNPIFLPAYYFVGVTGGLSAEPSEYGIIRGISELAEDPADVRLAFVHETIHVQQALAVGIEEFMQVFGPKMSLLTLSIREGAAYFLTLLSTGEHTLEEGHAYFVENEEDIWERFRDEMNERHPGDWLYVKPKDQDQPRDLGYLMGSRICEAFYERSEDKAKAIQEILSVVDYEEFLRRSGYGDNVSK